MSNKTTEKSISSFASKNNEKSRIDVSYCPSPYSIWNKLARALWEVVWLFLFRPSPKPLHAWRRFILRTFGAKIGNLTYIHASCQISEPWKLTLGDHSCLGPHVICYSGGGIQIGEHTTVSQYSHLCTASHDYTHPNMIQIFRPILIEDQVWICTDAYIGPGITVGQGVVVGARACVVKNIEPWTIVGGNPAKFIKKRELKET